MFPKKKEKTSDEMIFTGSPALSLPAPLAQQETAEVKSRVKSARFGAWATVYVYGVHVHVRCQLALSTVL